MSKMSTEMEEAHRKWTTAWGGETNGKEKAETLSPKKSQEPTSPEIEFTTEEIHEFVTEFDEMAAKSLEISPHPTFAKFLGRLTVPVVRKYSYQLDRAPEKLAALVWVAYVCVLWMEFQAVHTGEEVDEPADDIQKDPNF